MLKQMAEGLRYAITTPDVTPRAMSVWTVLFLGTTPVATPGGPPVQGGPAPRARSAGHHEAEAPGREPRRPEQDHDGRPAERAQRGEHHLGDGSSTHPHPQLLPA